MNVDPARLKLAEELRSYQAERLDPERGLGLVFRTGQTALYLFEAGFANFHLHPPTEVHFKNADRAPLLLVGATEDHTVPASLTKAAGTSSPGCARRERRWGRCSSEAPAPS